MSVAEKPGVLERLGSALNSSDLEPREDKIGAVELIGALAYTQFNPDASEHEALDAAVIDPRTELASVLVRLKYGGDCVLGDRAVELLAQWVRHQRAFSRWKLKYPTCIAARGERDKKKLLVKKENCPCGVCLLERFVRHGLAEWLYPVCGVCHGREMLGLDKGEIVERRIRCTRCRGIGVVEETTKNFKVRVRRDCRRCGGSGWMTYKRVRQTKTRECDSCHGAGRRRPNDAERARVLGVEYRVYQRHWLRRFDWMASGLDRLDTLAKWCLQSQMKPGINPA